MHQCLLSTFATGVLLFGPTLRAAEQAPSLCASVFRSGAVLQQNAPVPVWGSAPEGSRLELTLGSHTVETTAGTDGHWRAELPAHPADPLTSLAHPPAGHTLTIRCDRGEIREQHLEGLLFGEVWLCSGQSNMAGKVRNNRAKQNPDDDLSLLALPAIRQYRADTGWLSAKPGEVSEFSRVGVTFARHLQQELKIPVGLLFAAVGGTKIETWQRVDAESPEKHAPGSNYRKHIVPLLGYGMKGALWYQGEGNARDGLDYFEKLHTLIVGWRAAWQREDLPFLVVQLAGIGSSDPNQPTMGDGRAGIREAQFQAMRQIPHVGLATAIDIGTPGEHPPNKTDIGIRLARWALHHSYGRSGVVPSGPIYQGFEVRCATIAIQFKHGEGLQIGEKNGYGPVVPGPDDTPLPWISICDANGTWRWAQAWLEGDELVVHHPDVKTPTAVRYAYTHHPTGPYLYNAAGLPTFPFTTEELIEKRH